MKYIIIILAASCILGCKDTRLAEALADAEALQKSNDKLAQDLESAKLKAQKGQEKLASVCAELDSSLASMSPMTHRVSEDPIQIQEVSVTLYKVDASNGWAYLKYVVGDDTRYSDRLWFNEKRDRNSLLIDGTTLVSVESCTKEGCTLTSRALSEIRDVCKQP